jgi:hypothetical protein
MSFDLDSEVPEDDWSVFLHTPPGFDLGACLRDDRPRQSTFDPSELRPQSQYQQNLYSSEFETHTLILSGFPCAPPMDELMQHCAAFGQVYAIDPRMMSQGMAKVKFYDLGAAQAMRKSAHYLHGCPLTVSYGSDDWGDNGRQPVNNGTIVIFRIPTRLSTGHLADEFGKFGAIREIRDSPHNPSQKFVEFWDLRSAAAAVTKMNGWFLCGSRLAVEFSAPGINHRESLREPTHRTPTVERPRRTQ